jgi:glycerophosphoryl diester phosphodiesterase
MRVVSHRLRGFDDRDASIDGLKAALDAGVREFEFDLRASKDGALVVNHNKDLSEGYRSKAMIAEVTLEELQRTPPRFGSGKIATLEEYLDVVVEAPDAVAWIDVKEFGYEEKIIEAIDRRGLAGSVVIVSWLPETLLFVRRLRPALPLCFSHLPIKGGAHRAARFFAGTLRLSSVASRVAEILQKLPRGALRTKFHFDDYDRLDFDAYRGDAKPTDHEHVVSDVVEGALGDALRESGGGVCVPKNFADRALVERYRSRGIKTCVFSINDRETLERFAEEIRPDAALTDSAALATEWKS